MRVHPRDRNALRGLEIDAVLDESLAPGDVIAELRSGTIDLRLRARLENALDACARMTPQRRLCLGACAFGRALDALGAPLDGGPPLRGRRVSLELRSPRPNERAAIGEPIWTGIRVIDGLLTIGRGARVGNFRCARRRKDDAFGVAR